MLRIETRLWKTQYWLSRFCAALELSDKQLFVSWSKELEDDLRVNTADGLLESFIKDNYPFEPSAAAQKRRDFFCDLIKSGKIMVCEALLLDAFYHSDSQLVASVTDFFSEQKSVPTGYGSVARLRSKRLTELLSCINREEIVSAKLLLGVGRKESTQNAVDDVFLDKDEEEF